MSKDGLGWDGEIKIHTGNVIQAFSGKFTYRLLFGWLRFGARDERFYSGTAAQLGNLYGVSGAISRGRCAKLSGRHVGKNHYLYGSQRRKVCRKSA